MKKVLVIGISGAGKSTLSRELNKRTGLPVIHMDQYYWKPGWVMCEKEEWLERLDFLLKREEWIMDGNGSSTLKQRAAVADLIIYLDFNRYLALFRAMKRVIKGYGKTRPDLAEACPERFDWGFIKYIWNFHRDYRPRNEEALKHLAPHQKLVRLKNPSEVREFLRNFGFPSSEAL